MATITQWREPSQLVQGDTISFMRKLLKFPASQGWGLTYSLRGNGQVIEFASTPNGDDHVLLVPSATTETWLPGEYQMEGKAIFTDGTTDTFYLNNLPISPDLSTAAPDIDLRTHSEKMIAFIERELEKLAQNSLQETDVEQTRIVRVRRAELTQQRQSYVQERRGEIAAKAAKNGKPTGRKIKTVLSIMPPGATGIRQFGAGSVFETNYP